MQLFTEWLNEGSFKPVYKLTWTTDKGETVSQTFPDISGLIRQEKWLKEKGWTIVSAQKRRPYGKYEDLKS